MKVVTTNGVLFKATHGGKDETPLTAEEAEHLAAEKNKQVELLGLSVRYEVKGDDGA